MMAPKPTTDAHRDRTSTPAVLAAMAACAAAAALAVLGIVAGDLVVLGVSGLLGVALGMIAHLYHSLEEAVDSADSARDATTSANERLDALEGWVAEQGDGGHGDPVEAWRARWSAALGCRPGLLDQLMTEARACGALTGDED